MDKSAGVLFMKCVHLVVGTALVTAGAIHYVSINNYSKFVKQNITLIPLLVIIAGGIVLSILMLTVILSYKFNPVGRLRTVSLYIFPTLLIMQIAIGIYGCVQIRDADLQVMKTIQQDMRKDFLIKEVNIKYNEDYNKLQENLECCGVYGPEDYEPNIHLPASCCTEVRLNKLCEEKQERHRNGCAKNLYEKVRRSIGIISLVILVVAIFQIAGLICLGKICCWD